MPTTTPERTEPADRSPGRTITAVVQDAYGSPADVLSVGSVPLPVAGPGEVVVRVAAAGVDRGVWHLVAGLPLAVRPVIGLRRPKARVPGSDLAGTVEAVGPDVTRFRPGDEVFGVGIGSFATHARARVDKLAPKPAGLPFLAAAAVPISGLTALQAVRDQGRVQAGQRVLVIGASGGVGTFAAQLAVARGAEVTGVARTEKLDLVRGLGVHHVIDHTQEAITDRGVRYDVILDIGGQRPLRTLRRALAERGRLVIVGGETAGRWLGGTDRQLRAMAWSPFLRQRLGTFVSAESGADVAALAELIEQGQVVPVLDRTFPLAEAGAAVDHVAAGRARGKVVLTVGPAQAGGNRPT